MSSEKRKVTIYTDGGADPNPGPGGWGAILIDEQTGTIKELSGGDPSTTNNRMEVTAAISALEALKVPCDVTLYTDSTYLKNGITRWMPGWIAKGWKRKSGKIKNVDLWKRLNSTVEVHDVTWEWVKGHSGHEYNERADQLATEAIRAVQAGLQPTAPASEVDVYLVVSVRGSDGIWGALIRSEDGEQVMWAEEKGVSSNAIEIIAAAEALSTLPPGTRVNVYSRSDYIRNGASRWIRGWRSRGWKKRDGDPVANTEHWMMLGDILDELEVEWPAVKDEAARIEFEEVGRRIQEEMDMAREETYADITDVPDTAADPLDDVEDGYVDFPDVHSGDDPWAS